MIIFCFTFKNGKMAEEDVIDIKDEDLMDIISDPEKYKGWMVDILQQDNSKLCKKVIGKIQKNEIDGELDLLLRRLGNVVPYNMLIPSFRDQIGLSIQSDESCTEALNSIKQSLDSNEDKQIIDKIIEFVNSEEGELDGIVPAVELMAIIESIPVEKYPAIYNCIDYVTEITE